MIGLSRRLAGLGGVILLLSFCQPPEEPCEETLLFLRMANAVDDRSIELNWREVCEADSYLIIRNDTLYATSMYSPWTDTTCILGNVYRYAIQTVVDGLPADTSNILSATTIFPGPTELGAILIEEGFIEISWSDNCDFESAYLIMRDSVVIGLTTENQSTYLDDGAPSNQILTYSVSAMTPRGESAADTLSLKVRSYLSFSEIIVITEEVEDPTTIQLADMNGDGLEDLIYVSDDGLELGWFANLQNGNFGPKQVISENYHLPYQIILGDIDGDDLNDLVALTNTGQWELIWYKNLGSGAFQVQAPIDTFTSHLSGIFLVDMDHDGDEDLLIAGYSTYDTYWYLNNGTGQFGESSYMGGIIPEELFLVDLNSDNAHDLLIHFNNSALVWMANDGTPFDWGLDSNYYKLNRLDIQNVRDMTPIDFDLDGDIDIITTSINLYAKVTLLDNDGSGSFSSTPIIDDPPYGYTFYISANDFDLDGDVDVILSTYSQSLWSYENLGDNTLGERNLLGSSQSGGNRPYAIDIDGDGMLDILTANAYYNKIGWLRNEGRKVVLELQD